MKQFIDRSNSKFESDVKDSQEKNVFFSFILKQPRLANLNFPPSSFKDCSGVNLLRPATFHF